VLFALVVGDHPLNGSGRCQHRHRVALCARKWGDLNALLLGVGRTEVTVRIATLTAEAVWLLEPLPERVGGYLRRQMEFCSGFYGLADFWGDS
jgi:hypothetical protein